MKRLSSSETVWPALQKTWRELFVPFDTRRFLKMSLVAILAEGILVCYRFLVTNELTADFPLPTLDTLKNWHYRPIVIWAAISSAIVLAVFYYTVVRLRFVLFHCLAFQTYDLDAGWPRYGKAASRMLRICLLNWMLAAVFVGTEAVVIAVCVLPVFTFRGADGTVDPGIVLLMIIPATLTTLLLLAWMAALRIVLQDFILPHMALEDMTFWQARRTFRAIRLKERETFFWYLVLRIMLAVAPWAVVTAVATGLGYLLLWLLTAAGIGYDLLLGDTGRVGTTLKWIMDGIFVMAGLGVGGLLAAIFGGPLAVFTRNFALLFYAGRYHALGAVMDAQNMAEEAPKPAMSAIA